MYFRTICLKVVLSTPSLCEKVSGCFTNLLQLFVVLVAS
uniref:Uncharacterized protein n=1 Tax=Arundo donax TaxID=35708 RepID=A0A0A9AAQ6_ARUDO